jgi:hypothetical protein
VYLALTSQRSVHVWDFQPLWQAGRWILEGRGDPYSDQMTRLLQMQSYGRLARGGEDPRAFVYPLYALLLMAPVLFLPHPWAQAAWFTLLELALILGIAGATRLVSWRLPARQTLLTVMWGFLLYPIAWALVLGQVSILIFGLIIAALLALRSGREVWAGVFLALTTAKPQMSFLIVPALLLWAFVRRRTRFLVSFAVSIGGLLALSFAVLPEWVAGVLRAGAGYFEAQPFPPPIVLLGRALAGEQGEVVAAALAVLLFAGLIWAWWRELVSESFPLWAVGVTLIVTALVAPRTSMVNQVPLLLPLCLVLSDLARHGRSGVRLGVAIQLILLVGLWGIDILWFPPVGSGEHWHAQQRFISPVVPGLLLILLGTRLWWRRRAISGQ